MKTKIKRHYRSAVSVLLSVCILVSCIAVGLIGTDAARVTDDEAVGALTWTPYYIGTQLGDNWATDHTMTHDSSNNRYYIEVSTGGQFKIRNYGDWNNSLNSSAVDDSYGDLSLSGTDNIVDSNTGTHYIVVDVANSKVYAVSSLSLVNSGIAIVGDAVNNCDDWNHSVTLWDDPTDSTKCSATLLLQNDKDFKFKKGSSWYGGTADGDYWVSANAGSISTTGNQNFKWKGESVQVTVVVTKDSSGNPASMVITGGGPSVSIVYGFSGDTDEQGAIVLEQTASDTDLYESPTGQTLDVSGNLYINPRTGSSGSYEYPWWISGSDTDKSRVNVDYESDYWQNYSARENGNHDGKIFAYLQTKSEGSGLPYSFQYRASTKQIIIRNAASPLATSVTLTSSDTVTDANDKVTLTATLTVDKVPGGPKTYTFTGDNGFSQEVTTTDSSTAIEVTQNNSSSVNYTVKVSKTGYKPVTSSSVTVTNPNVHESHYALSGQLPSGQAWPEQYANAKKINSYSGTGEIFYIKVNINSTNENDQPNLFRLLNKSNKRYSPASNTTLEVGGTPVTAIQQDGNQLFRLKADTVGTYRLYVDESTANPTVWLSPDIDFYKSTSELVIDDSEVIKTMEKTDADAIEYTGIANHAELNGGNAITTEQVFTLSDTDATNLDLDYYTVLLEKNVGVTFYAEDVKVTVTEGEDEVQKNLQVFHLKSNSTQREGSATTYSTEHVRLHFDFVNKTVYATSTMDETDISDSGLSSEKIRVYFAEEASNDDSGTDSLDSISNGIKVAYWNNSLNNHNKVPSVGTGAEYVEVSRAGGQTNKGDAGEIYVDMTGETFSKMGVQGTYTPSKGDHVKFHMYYIDVPVWATTFCFLNSSNNALGWVGETDKGAGIGAAVNPNRVYLLYNDSGSKMSAVVLDDALLSPSANTNRPGVKTFKANTLKISSNGNKVLEDIYSQENIRNALYYGGFVSSVDGQYYNFRRVNNLAQRNSETNDDNATYAKRAYHALVWGLSGGMLDVSRKNVTDGYWLMDSDGKTTAPYFDYDNVGTNGVASELYTNTDFPFYKSTYKGITTYSYDSLSDPNRQLKSDHKSYSTNTFIGAGQFNAFAPFGTGKVYAVATEFDIPFYMTPTGTVIDDDDVEHDIIYSFSGDDDVWVYIDGVKVLDLGGDHAISAGVINLTDMKVYYKNAAAYTDTLSTTNESYAWSADSIYTVDLKALFEAYGVNFDNTNATKKHMLQMFYMERGESESNFSASFNLPQNSGLRVQNEIDLSGVNDAFDDDVKKVADDDYFNYKIDHTLTTAAERDAISAEWAKTLPAAATGVGSDFTNTPKYPLPGLSEDANRTQTFGSGAASTTIEKLLAKSGQTEPTANAWNSANETLSGSTFNITGLNYKLIDAYVQPKQNLSGTIATSGGINTFNLLYDQAAVFEKKITPHTTLKIVQDDALYTVKENTDNITKSDSASSRTVSAYYKTSYSIVDDGTHSKIGQGSLDNNGGNAVTAKDIANNDGFYFTDYSGENPDSVAMTVDFVNSPATGDIKIQKLLDGVSAQREFVFEVKFSNIFGGSDDTLKEYENLTYDVLNSSGNVIAANKLYGNKGIAISATQTAVIRNVPVGTNYVITEKSLGGFTVKTVTGFVTKDTTSNITATAVKSDYHIEYSVPELTSAYNTSEALYTVTNKEKLQDVTIKKVISNSGNSTQDFPVSFKVTAEGMPSFRYKIGNASPVTVDTSGHASDPTVDPPTTTVNIKQGTDVVLLDLPVDAVVEVSEGALPSTFNYVSIDVDNKIADSPAKVIDNNNRKITFAIAKEKDPTVTITNSIDTRKVTVYKRVNVAKDVGDAPFEITLGLTENGASAAKTLTAADVYAAGSTSGITVGSGNVVQMNNDNDHICIIVPIDATLTVKETNMPDSFYFEKIALSDNGAAQTLTDGTYTVATGSADVNVYVHNLKKVKLEVGKVVTGTSETSVPFYFRVLKLVESTYSDYATTYTVKKTDNTTEDRDVESTGDNAGAVALYNGETIIISGLTHYQDFRIYEMSIPEKYRTNGRALTGGTSDASDYDGESGDGYYGKNFKVTTSDAKLTVTNKKVTTLQVTKKVTDAPYDYSTFFNVRIMTQSGGVYSDIYNGSSPAEYASLSGTNKTGATIVRNAQAHIDPATSTVDYYYYQLHQDDVLNVPNIEGGTNMKVVEVNLDTLHYTYDAIHTTAENISGTATDVDDTHGKGLTFTVSADTASLPKVSIYNTAITHSVTVNKKTNFYTDDGSTFKIKVTYNPYGKTGDYINATTGQIYDANNNKVTPDPDLSADGEYIVKKDWHIVFDKVTHGTDFVVDETAYGDSDVTKEQRFILDRITDGVTTLNTTNQYFTIDSEKTIDVYNKIFKNDIDITKVVNRITGETTDTVTTHRIVIDMWKNGRVETDEHYIPNTTTDTDIVTISSSTDNGTTFTTAETITSFPYTLDIKENEIIRLHGVYAGSYVSVQESVVGANYQFDKFEYSNIADYKSGTDNDKYESIPKPTTDTTTRTLTFQTKNLGSPATRALIKVYNTPIRARYVINYKYKPYFLLTDTNTSAIQHYTVEGTFTPEELENVVLKDGDTITFRTGSDASTARKNFLSGMAPYEDNFMESLTWDSVIDGESGTVNTTSSTSKDDTTGIVTMTIDFTAIVTTNRTVNAYFRFPYATNSDLSADNGVSTLGDFNQQLQTTQYGKWISLNGVYDDEDNAQFVTAPEYVSDGGTTKYFHHWNIQSANDTGSRNEGKQTSIFKKCYYREFNMTMYHDCYITPVFETGGPFTPKDLSWADTTGGEASINFIENSRNQWNNNGGTSPKNTSRVKEGDRIYSDFVLTFGHNDLALNGYVMDGSTKKYYQPGFVLEKVAEVGDETKTAQQYYDLYNSTFKPAYVNYYITGSGSAPDGYDASKFITKQSIKATQLDNKNQMKYSFSIPVRDDRDISSDTNGYKNYVYRAYSYLKSPDGTLLKVSDPIYFTIYDMASIANGTTS